MNSEELRSMLSEMMALPVETEWIEFKEAKANFDFDKLGRYFSALSNEANLQDQRCRLADLRHNRQAATPDLRDRLSQRATRSG